MLNLYEVIIAPIIVIENSNSFFKINLELPNDFNALRQIILRLSGIKININRDKIFPAINHFSPKSKDVMSEAIRLI